VDRLRLKGIPKAIRPMLPRVRNMVALVSIGLASYPGISGHAAPTPEAKTNSVSVEGRKPGEPSDFSSFWIPVRATSYCWQEPDHAPYGHKNCMGGDLTKPVEGLFQCAADLSVYPLGTILCIKIDDVEEFRIVTDCGKAVKGAHHLDLHFNTLAEMDAKGTQHALIFVIRRGWTSQETLP
jgi:3D (Asp-Asp-Asp) domain-containing protein